jgi:hypothetical protein
MLADCRFEIVDSYQSPKNIQSRSTSVLSQEFALIQRDQKRFCVAELLVRIRQDQVPGNP